MNKHKILVTKEGIAVIIEGSEEELHKKISDAQKFIGEFEKIGIKPIELGKKIELEAGIKKLASAVNVSQEKLKHVFDFEKDDLHITTQIGGKSEEEKQLNATLSILTGLEYCYGEKKLTSLRLKKKLGRLGIRSLTNLAASLSKYPQFIIREGRGTKATYKLTVPGRDKGVKVISQLVMGKS